MSLDLSQLNDSQREAVNWATGPLLVLAGPGSGKTKVLTCRIARLIGESAQERFRILGITFTNKAASEMRNRIDSMVNVGRERASLTTFHAFSAEILRQHGSHVGLTPDFALLTETADREAILADVIRENLAEEDFFPKAFQLVSDGFRGPVSKESTAYLLGR